MENAFDLICTPPPQKIKNKKQQKGQETLQRRGWAPREEGKQQHGRTEPGEARAPATTQAARGAEGKAPASRLLQGTGAAAEDATREGGGPGGKRGEKPTLFFFFWGFDIQRGTADAAGAHRGQLGHCKQGAGFLRHGQHAEPQGHRSPLAELGSAERAPHT